MTSGHPAPSTRTRIRRAPHKARYDRATVHAILDEALLVQVALVADDGSPRILPLFHGRDGDTVYLHGSVGSQSLRAVRDGRQCCLAAVLVDEVVLARSGFHHSANHRSVMAYGPLREVTDERERLRALDLVVDHLVAGRATQLRPPTRRELAATSVLAFDVSEASAKIRTGPPVDEPGDATWPVWAGVIDVRMRQQGAVAAPDLPADVGGSPQLRALDPGGAGGKESARNASTRKDSARPT